jgi:(hydroxyamino)benzene mutase
MALSSHLEAVLNGMFLVVLGLLSPHIDLPNAWRFTAVVLIACSAYRNWLAALLAAAWGAGRKLAPTVAADHEASPANEGLVSFLLASLSLSIVVGLGIVIVGLRRRPVDTVMRERQSTLAVQNACSSRAQHLRTRSGSLAARMLPPWPRWIRMMTASIAGSFCTTAMTLIGESADTSW